MLKDRSSDTIAAIATAMSSSGIGIIRVSGEQAVSIVNRIFISRKDNFDLNTAPSHHIYYGMIQDGEEVLDEVLVMLMRGPHSYTAEDTVEIDCHGGIMVNIDGNSNRVSCIAQGPKKVIIIAGMNKVCSDLDAAMKRARNVAAPANAQRFDIKTPCKEKGKCFDCKSPDTICCQFLITRYSRHTGRIHVILVNDNLGF